MIERVAPDVHAIGLTRVKAHLLLGPELSLVDTGFRGSATRIRAAIESLGRSTADLTRVICTHGHPDHAGSASELGRLGASVLMHPADAAGLATTWRAAFRHPARGRFFAAMTPLPSEIVPIVDGDVLPVLGGLEVVHTPGHTPGSICLYARRDRLLFVGDALQRRLGRVSYASGLFSDDHVAAKRAVKRLAALDVGTIIFSHFPPLRDGAIETLSRLARDVGD